jgi:tryptophan synthase alpha chain
MARAAADSGADALEIGIPFSDPVMDGPVIQAASERALALGANPLNILGEIATLDLGVPVAVMTYYNLVFRFGLERFAATAHECGVAAAILPDLPLEESGPWSAAADLNGVETVMLVAPTSPDERVDRICARARGFVYGVGLLGVTGERAALASTALAIAERLKQRTETPVLIGVGVSTPAQAVEASAVADGVVVGSAVVRTMIETGSPTEVGALVAQFRTAMDLASIGPS